jgi:hypothetical protein
MAILFRATASGTCRLFMHDTMDEIQQQMHHDH